MHGILHGILDGTMHDGSLLPTIMFTIMVTIMVTNLVTNLVTCDQVIIIIAQHNAKTGQESCFPIIGYSQENIFCFPPESGIDHGQLSG